MGKKEQKVWKYLLKNKLATPKEVAKATGVSYGYANQLMKRIGTPREIFEGEIISLNKQKAFDHLPTFDEAILRAPIRDNYNVWKDRAMHIGIAIAIVVVIGAWLQMMWWAS